MGLHKYQGAQQVHEAFVPTGPGSKARNHRLIVTVTANAVPCPLGTPQGASHNDGKEFFHSDR